MGRDPEFGSRETNEVQEVRLQEETQMFDY